MRITYLGQMPRDKQTNWSEECQGLTHDQDSWYIAQKTRLWRTPVGRRLNQDLDESQSRGIPDDLKNKGFDHIGDLDHFDERLFAPLEDLDRHNPPRVGVFAAGDLAFLGSAALNQDAAPWCAINPLDGVLFSSVFDPRGLHRYSIEVASGGVTVSEMAALALLDEDGKPLKLHHVQGGAFAAGGVYLILVCDHSDETGAPKGFSIFETATGRRLTYRQVSYDPISIGGEIEGVDVWTLIDPVNGAPNALVHILVLNNDTFDDDNIMIQTWRVIFDPPPAHPGGRALNLDDLEASEGGGDRAHSGGRRIA